MSEVSPPTEDSNLCEKPVDSDTAAPQIPRLGIIHIILWTIGCGFLLGSFREWFGDGSGQEGYSMLVGIYYVIVAIIYGAAVGSLPLFVSLRRRGIPVLNQPGHWLLLIAGVEGFVNAVAAVLVMSVTDPASDWQQRVWLVYFCGFLLGKSALCALPIIYVRMRMRWILVFAASIVFGMLHLIQYGMMFIILSFDILFRFAPWVFHQLLQVASELTVALILASAVVLDRRSGIQRDWLHWAGVVVWLSAAAIAVLWQVFWM